ncbi:hypothetical protein AVEN_232123-1 [Araneus ventricosus]|uniref:Uncharacterized protein n=1 Tax=Araneus ventricosus TaxID=182803 RepID=A0A4Y2TBP1_ARAVE|nr:hypothetical protein AVEN_232123-1 [Araneus ventricosus]
MEGIRSEDHPILICEPRGLYADHVAPVCGTGMEITALISIWKIMIRTLMNWRRWQSFCHAENVLLAMIMVERQHVPELGYRRVMKRRTGKQKEKPDRTF